MEEKANNTNANRLTARQQRLLLRAVVGSLVLSAALSSTAAAQGAKPDAAPQENTALISARLNPQPLRALLAKAARLQSDGLISWGDTFEITFEAERATDGTLRNLSTTGVASVNDRWPELMRELASAVGESGLLAQFGDAERVSLSFRLDDRRGASAALSFETPSTKHASQLQAAYGMLLQVAARTRGGRPEEALFRGANVTANGKQFAITLEMPREQLGNLLSQSLAIP